MQAYDNQNRILLHITKYLLALLTIEGVDYIAGRQVVLWYLMLVPIGLSAWNHGKTIGRVVLALALCIALADALWVGGPFSETRYALFAFLGRCLIFILVHVLVLKLRQKEVERVRIGTGY